MTKYVLIDISGRPDVVTQVVDWTGYASTPQAADGFEVQPYYNLPLGVDVGWTRLEGAWTAPVPVVRSTAMNDIVKNTGQGNQMTVQILMKLHDIYDLLMLKGLS